MGTEDWVVENATCIGTQQEQVVPNQIVGTFCIETFQWQSTLRSWLVPRTWVSEKGWSFWYGSLAWKHKSVLAVSFWIALSTISTQLHGCLLWVIEKPSNKYWQCHHLVRALYHLFGPRCQSVSWKIPYYRQSRKAEHHTFLHKASSW